MGANTKIEWANHTFNPWWGCVEPSPACDNCYAREFAHRLGFDIWGKDKPRRFFGDAHWNEPLKWNRAAKAAGVRERVFCASMGDVLEARTDLAPHRQRLWELIAQCDQLEWLLLTKRAGNFKRMVPRAWMQEGQWPANVWPGVTVENLQQLQLRVPALCKLPSLQKFLSMEPLLEDVAGAPGSFNREVFTAFLASGFEEPPHTDVITWVIAGGESGHNARPALRDWYQHVRDACAQYRVAFHFKQWGEWAPGECGEDKPFKTERVASLVDGRWNFGELTPRQSEELHADDEPDVYRLGKKASGRMLDDREWNEVPTARTWTEAGV